MTIFFTADTHWGHKKVVELCNRPFSSSDEMDEALIDNWNGAVGKRDTVYHAGDFAINHKMIEGLLRRLNGSIHLIRGNHDPESHTKLLKLGFASVHEAHYLRVGETRVYIHHYACRVWRKSNHGAWHVFGHSHGAREDVGRSTDVGTDCWNYTPVAFETLEVLFKDRPFVDHHAAE